MKSTPPPCRSQALPSYALRQTLHSRYASSGLLYGRPARFEGKARPASGRRNARERSPDPAQPGGWFLRLSCRPERLIAAENSSADGGFMRATPAAAVLVALFLAASGLVAQRQLTLLATVTDPGGAEITTVDLKDVRVTENGAVATILKVEPVNRVPKVQILIDNGLGMPPESIGDLRNGLRGLIEALPPGIEVQIVTTAPQPRFLERATTDRQKLIDSVNRLSPDSGAGRFVESLSEATQRIEKDKDQDAFYTIVTVGTSSGDTNVRERDVQQTMQRLQKYGTVVHVAILQQLGRTASAGVIQGELGQAAAKQSGGRFENLAVANRLATLLPEIGAQMSKMLGAGSRQFRITFERPGGASGDLGQLSAGVAGKIISALTLERR
jgi:hypothetical protein